jgi:multidrug efflux pump subunit AcrA (membrane-fusion protein)
VWGWRGLQTKGTIVKWHVAVGDPVKENQLLYDVETTTLTVRADHKVRGVRPRWRVSVVQGAQRGLRGRERE